MDEKLKSMHDSARRHSELELSRHTSQIARLIAGVLKEGTWASPSANAKKDLERAVAAARDAAIYLDAAAYVAEKVLDSATSRVVQLRLKADLADVQRQISELFDVGEAPRRGFVYVSWSRRPEHFFYAGKASSAERLNLSGHGKLANTIGRATTLSLIFPSRSTEEILAGLEASVLALIEHQTGYVPELNVRDERVPDHEGTTELEALRDFLIDVADGLTW